MGCYGAGVPERAGLFRGECRFTESRDYDGCIAQSASQPFPGEIERKVDACDEQIGIVRVADTEIHRQSLFERGSLQGRHICD